MQGGVVHAVWAVADLKERQIKRMFLLEFLVDIVRPILFNKHLLFGIQGSSKPKPSAFYVRTYAFKNSRCHIKRRKHTMGVYLIRRKDGIDVSIHSRPHPPTDSATGG